MRVIRETNEEKENDSSSHSSGEKLPNHEILIRSSNSGEEKQELCSEKIEKLEAQPMDAEQHEFQ